MATEFEIIKKLRELFPKIGDDAAKFSVSNIPIVSTDSFVIGEHFGDYFTPYDMGYKSLAASLSDIAACGGVPRYALISIGLKKGDMEFVEEFYRGVQTVAKDYGTEIIGGDTTKSQTPFVSVTVIGETTHFIGRKGAKLGDRICVTGTLGGSFAGLLALQNGIKSRLTKRHLNPVPRIKEGVELALFATSMMDISDGLIIDLSHILDESGVGAKIWRSGLPIDKETERIADKFSSSPQEFAMNGGEDFELLCTIPQKCIKEAKKKVAFTEIGEIIKINKPQSLQSSRRRKGDISAFSVVEIIDEEGGEIPIKGFDHFMPRNSVVTIDGPAGSGKSTTARLVAERLGYKYIDSGATYRALAITVKRNEIDPKDESKVERLSANIDIKFIGGKIFLDGNDITNAIRDEEIGKLASLCSTYKGVRENMVNLQRKLVNEVITSSHSCSPHRNKIGSRQGVICEGRDIGTVVFPDADLKIYMDANLLVRAKRRKKELSERGLNKNLKSIIRDLKARDTQDKSRQHSPLKIPDGAFIIDTTNLTIEEEIERVIKAIKRVIK